MEACRFKRAAPISNAPLESDYLSEQLFGALRVDEMPIHHINYVVSFNVGERFYTATVTNFDNGEKILEEFVKGNRLRVKLKYNSVEVYLNFSLLGFTAASERTLQMCMRFNNEKPDKDYFNEEPFKMNDKGVL